MVKTHDDYKRDVILLQENLNLQLMLAIKKNEIYKVLELIDKGADVNYKCEAILYTPLAKAVECLNFSIVEILIEAGADPTYVINPFLNSDQCDIINYLTSRTNSNKKEHLHFMKWFKSYPVQKKIIEIYPLSIYSFKRNGIINEDIEIEYQYLIKANHLNLL